MKTIIIGFGEIGQALFEVLAQYKPDVFSPHQEVFGRYANGRYEVMHICFGYSKNFIAQVKKYQKKWKPKYTVIHSTVPVGTCRKLKAIHSPVIGQHPFLEQGIRTFEKMLGGANAIFVADYFRRAGLKVVLFDDSNTTEAAKLYLTEYYRECIEFAKRVKMYCDLQGLNFSEVYRIPNEIYNKGYQKLGFEEFVRPILQPIMTEVGGHCVMPNSKLIKMSE